MTKKDHLLSLVYYNAEVYEVVNYDKWYQRPS